MDTDRLVVAIREWLEERRPGDPGEHAVFRLRSGREVPLDLPPVLPPRRPAAEPDQGGPLHQLERDVLDVIEAAGRRLKRDDVVDALGKARKDHGESTVWKRLARMVREGKLSHDDDGKGYGYGLPFWGDAD